MSTIIIPRNVKDLLGDNFYYCYGLQNVILPNEITNIGKDVFNYCHGLKSVLIPKHLTEISDRFYKCDSLINYFISTDTVPTLTNASLFTEINPATVWWIKDDIIDQFKSATNWSNGINYMKPLSWYPSLTDPNA
jgi:hypothetical protein